MKIRINSTEIEVPTRCTLTQALAQWLSTTRQDQAVTQMHTADYAIALNQEFVSRAEYDTRALKIDDDIELLTPMSGG